LLVKILIKNVKHGKLLKSRTPLRSVQYARLTLKTLRSVKSQLQNVRPIIKELQTKKQQKN
jgi:hypothetical protein